jgi:hypothetical protein
MKVAATGLTSKEVSDALDYFCDPVNPMDTGSGDFVHASRIYLDSARRRHCCPGDSAHPRSKRSITAVIPVASRDSPVRVRSMTFEESRLAARLIIGSFQLFFDLFPHVAVQVQFDLAEGTDDIGALCEFFYSKVILPSADWTCNRQFGLLHASS